MATRWVWVGVGMCKVVEVKKGQISACTSYNSRPAVTKTDTDIDTNTCTNRDKNTETDKDTNTEPNTDTNIEETVDQLSHALKFQLNFMYLYLLHICICTSTYICICFAFVFVFAVALVTVEQTSCHMLCWHFGCYQVRHL